MKYYVRTYGCQMNVADSNEMGRHLEARGALLTDDPDDAQIYLVNTCTVRQHAEDRALSEIGRLRCWKEQAAGRRVVITGCAAERTKDFLERRFPHIDLVVGAKSIENFSASIDGLLDALIASRPSEMRANDESLDYASGVSNSNVASFVTIMRGCNYSCTYCIVPSVRGRESYRPMDEVLADVRERVEEGVSDITLLGQTVNSYHRDGKGGKNSDFADLLEAVGAVDGVKRIRFISPHPFYMTERVIEAMATVPAVCEGLHLPVQSGSNAMLRAMLRNYTRQSYLELVGKLRRAMPDIVLSTDVIVGFPGETEEDFRETLSLVDEVRFDWGFIFKYSARAATAAAALDPHPESLIEARHAECLALAERIGADARRRFDGTVQEILVEESDPGTGSVGRTRGNFKVRLEEVVQPGTSVDVRITSTDRITFDGEVCPTIRSLSGPSPR